MQITSGLPEGFNAGAYDMIVVGAGYAGAVCARRLAETIGYRVAVLERRSHICLLYTSEYLGTDNLYINAINPSARAFGFIIEAYVTWRRHTCLLYTSRCV